MVHGSKSFSLASVLLPRRVRDAATALYAFCRLADDAVDADPSATTETVERLRKRLDDLYRMRPLDHPVDRALSVIVARERLPKAPLEGLLEGFAWDAVGRRYETLAEVEAYAARVAATVGTAMTIIMGRRNATTLARACDLGVAMQLTNIARDVGEDAANGRIYLPLSWMREEGVDPDAWLADPRPSDGVRRVVERLLDAADALYARADEGIPFLPADCRTAIRAARLVYSDIGRSIAKAGFDSVTRRAHVPLARKLWLLVRSLGARWMSVKPKHEPPLEPVRFLVDACGSDDDAAHESAVAEPA
ncbi:MAG: phytoene/squalene synthase family protein [Deltaproteobacteria bacterium]|nr:phytoene/squalene synthase family protein [Deltaproteobacteria bacterium]